MKIQELALNALIAEGNTTPSGVQIKVKMAALKKALDDSLALSPQDEAKHKADQVAAINKAAAVDNYLMSLQQSDPDTFEIVRREPFEKQAARAGA